MSSKAYQLTCRGSKLLPTYAKNPEKVKLYRELAKINLKPVKKIEYKFDPFHSRALTIRELMFQLSSKEKQKTNRDVFFKTDVLSNLEEPVASITFFNDYKLVFKTANLSLFDMAFHYNSISQKFIEEMEQ